MESSDFNMNWKLAAQQANASAQAQQNQSLMAAAPALEVALVAAIDNVEHHLTSCPGRMWTLQMQSPAADGWQGAHMLVSHCDGNVLFNSTLPNGHTAQASLCLPEQFSVSVAEGTKGQEVQWKLAADGAAQHLSGGAPYTGTLCSKADTEDPLWLNWWEQMVTGITDQWRSALHAHRAQAPSEQQPATAGGAALAEAAEAVNSTSRDVWLNDEWCCIGCTMCFYTGRELDAVKRNPNICQRRPNGYCDYWGSMKYRCGSSNCPHR